jgi:polysaccharide deacetylase family protein (PEP-CTERM system associated)
VEANVRRILELFGRYNVTGTFFVLGWVAERFPGLVREIARAGHEIGCHGYAHSKISRLSAEEFRSDLKHALASLADQVGSQIKCYRAPSFSIVESTMWAFDILAEEGIVVDSSVFPVQHDLYGVRDAQRFPHWHRTPHGHRVFEFPPSTYRVRNNNWAMAGGGYLRLLPYGMTYWAIRQINTVERQPVMVYFHPWEIDPGQPRIQASLRSTFRHYVNLSTMEQKIERLLQDFRFTTLAQACAVHERYGETADDATKGNRLTRTAKAADSTVSH